VITKFSDVNQTDPLEQDLLIDLDPIYQSIHNIIYTEKNQRLFLPEFGTDLIQYIFEPMTIEILFAIKNEIIRAIEIWEPRVQINRGKTEVTSYKDTHLVDLFLVFNIIGLDDDEYVFQTRLDKNKLGQYYAK